MRTGILTLPLHNNIGGILQAYALQTVLNKLGHEAIVIDRQPPKVSFYSIGDVKMEIMKRIFKNKFSNKKELQVIRQNTKYFREKYIQPITRTVRSDRELRKLAGQYAFDAIIVGSDQVWRLEYSKSLKKNYFLDFVPEGKTKKISYAASFGVDTWKHDEKVTRELAGLLQKFDAVSVREKSGVGLCKGYFGVDAQHHVDPTMLLEQDDYRSLLEKENEPALPGKVFSYILDMNTDKKQVIEKAADINKLEPHILNTKKKFQDKRLEKRIYPRVTHWIRGFSDAGFVVTDSFHGCVFSIIFNKPFVVMGNKKRGLSRFNSILEQFGLTDRLLLSFDDLKEEHLTTPPDYNKVNQIINRQRERSFEYLQSALKKD